VIGAFWGKRGAQQARQLEGARNNAPRLVLVKALHRPNPWLGGPRFKFRRTCHQLNL
jgi:hypothetical protein